MRPIEKQLLSLVIFICSIYTSYSQCDQTLPDIVKCNMETIDFDTDGDPDGIINLYTETGTTPADGVWMIEPRYATALNPTNGNVSLWILPAATTSVTLDEYSFTLMNATCGDTPFRTVRLILGPYSGIALPRTGDLNVNAQGCDDESFDLFTAFVLDETTPAPHQNGIWTYNGSSPNFVGFDPMNPSRIIVDIPYQEGEPIPDQEAFEFTYTVSGTSPCVPTSATTVRISMVRQVSAGSPSEIDICESEILAGVFDADIDLRDDRYLSGEDIDNGFWFSDEDPTGQIANDQDSFINLRTIYEDFVTANGNNLRFGCSEFEFSYGVRQRSGVCSDDKATISFTFYEQLRPFRQPDPAPEFCANQDRGSLNLFDLLEFTTETTTSGASVDFVYDSDSYTNWRRVSGPGTSDNNLGLMSLIDATGNLNTEYTHLGTINTLNATPGTYVFEYLVSPKINCQDSADETCNPLASPLDDFYCEHPCAVESALVTIEILAFDYPGEDTVDVNLCISDMQVDLRSLLETNGSDVVATTGVWTDSSGGTINNTFVFPDSITSQTYTFTYTTNRNGCNDSADLTFTIHTEPNAGEDASILICSDNRTLTLFDLLGGTPDTTGEWTGPFGYSSEGDNRGIFIEGDDDLFILQPGEYVYNVPANDGCTTSDQATVMVNFVDPVAIGDDINETFCKTSGSINLFTLLERSTIRTGTFVDPEDTGALSPDGTVDFQTLESRIYTFRYVVNAEEPCGESALNINLQIIDIPVPEVPAQEFCILDAVRLDDIVVDVSNYSWYASLESETPILDNPLLLDNQTYYIAANDGGNEQCESERLAVPITILNTGERSLDGELCTLDFQDGVSPNGDNQNDTFSLFIDDVYNIPEAFPDFDLKIYNRYGSIVYEGRKDTEEFRGESNTSVRLGDDLPSGTYFYIFTPNFQNNQPIQGSFYLSR